MNGEDVITKDNLSGVYDLRIHDDLGDPCEGGKYMVVCEHGGCIQTVYKKDANFLLDNPGEFCDICFEKINGYPNPDLGSKGN